MNPSPNRDPGPRHRATTRDLSPLAEWASNHLPVVAVLAVVVGTTVLAPILRALT